MRENDVLLMAIRLVARKLSSLAGAGLAVIVMANVDGMEGDTLDCRTEGRRRPVLPHPEGAAMMLSRELHIAWPLGTASPACWFMIRSSALSVPPRIASDLLIMVPATSGAPAAGMNSAAVVQRSPIPAKLAAKAWFCRPQTEALARTMAITALQERRIAGVWADDIPAICNQGPIDFVDRLS
ncbi:MAG: hypothetical protein V4647_04360 [Pseudomonadota bacterium]